MAPSPTADATRFTDRWRTSRRRTPPGQARLPELGWAGGRPPGRPPAGDHEVPPGQHIALLVAGDGVAEPLGAGLGADEHEQGRRGHGLGDAPVAVAERQYLQPRPAVAVHHLDAQPDGDVGGRLDLLDQVVRHGGAEGVAPDEHGDRGRLLGQVDGGLPGRVATPDHEHPLALRGLGLAPGRPVEHARAGQLLQAGHGQSSPGHPGCQQHRSGGHLAAVGQAQPTLGAAPSQAADRLGEDEVGAEQPGLLEGPDGQVVAADAVGEPGMVADQGAGHGRGRPAPARCGRPPPAAGCRPGRPPPGAGGPPRSRAGRTGREEPAGSGPPAADATVAPTGGRRSGRPRTTAAGSGSSRPGSRSPAGTATARPAATG